MILEASEKFSLDKKADMDAKILCSKMEKHGNIKNQYLVYLKEQNGD